MSSDLGRRRRILRAKSAPNLRHHRCMLWCAKPLPARRSRRQQCQIPGQV